MLSDRPIANTTTAAYTHTYTHACTNTCTHKHTHTHTQSVGLLEEMSFEWGSTHMFTRRTEPVPLRNGHQWGTQTSHVVAIITAVAQQYLKMENRTNEYLLVKPFISLFLLMIIFHWNGGGFFLTCTDFRRMFNNSFSAYTFFVCFFKVEISWRKLIPLFRPGSVHSGSASWDDCDWVCPDELRVSSFPDRFPHSAWTAV